jgi:methylmalonyl-CoA/ethylmalonyl-CoA epimerase
MPTWKDLVRSHALGIDHIAIAVPDLDASVAFYTGLLGCELVDERETRGESTGMRSAVVVLGGVTIVLVQGSERESQVTRFVTHFGPGVQHVAIAVRELAPVVDLLREHGIEFETAVIESPYTRQIFTIRDPQIGVRIELIERRGKGFSDRAVEQLFRFMETRGAI